MRRGEERRGVRCGVEWIGEWRGVGRSGVER